jgi:hypothetical protein
MASGRKTSLSIALTGDCRRELRAWQRSTTIPMGLARRGQIILLLSSGVSVSEVSRTVGMERPHVYKWARRFIQNGIDGLSDKPGRGRGREAETPSGEVSVAPRSLITADCVYP